MNIIQPIDRIPTPLTPLGKQYIKPITQFFQQWINNPIFFQDFLYSCPFNSYLTDHFNAQTRIYSIPDTWHMLFQYFSHNYSAKELADLIYEVLHDLDQDADYLQFLITQHYHYMWPTGENFCDPFLETPPKPSLQ